MKKGKFHFGGIHPHISKDTAEKASVRMPKTKTISISLFQHAGKPAIAKKSKGDIVAQGELLAEADGLISANIHASIAGKISIIEIAPPPLGRSAPSMLIQVDENANTTEYKENKDYKRLRVEDILKKIKDAGLVGMGGAMFPTSVKLTGSIDKRIDTIIINGAECEPYITADHRMMLEYTEQIVVAINIIRYVIPSVSRVIVGIEDNKQDALDIMEKHAKSNDFEVFSLKTRYPQGGEKQLIEATTDRIVPMGQLPFDIGVLVQNIASLYAIYEAVIKNKPLIDRLITVAGDGIKESMNVWVPIGTKIQDVVDFAGGLTSENILAIAGGPMMGSALPSLEQHTIKGTNSILIFKRENYKIPKEYACIKCSKCIDVCPIKILPTSIVRAAKSNNHEKMLMLEIHACIECGCCSYICPSHIPLVHWIRVGKDSLRKATMNAK